jgi:hypothetical protein
VGSRAGLDAVSKRKIPSPHRESNPDNPIIQPVVGRPGFHSQQEQGILFVNSSRPAPGPIQPPIKRVLGTLPGGKAAGV